MERSTMAGAAESMHGFPVALTSFVGRAQAVDEIAGQLRQDRLVTVTGPGGAGKTRLAAEVAKQVADRFADGVWLAELAAVRDPAHVPAAMAASREPLRIAGEVRYRLGPRSTRQAGPRASTLEDAFVRLTGTHLHHEGEQS